MKRDIYQRITQQITSNLEKAGSWQKLWNTPQPVSLNEPNVENAAAYLKSWLKVLESNPSWIVWAANKAQKACEFIVPAEVPDEVPF